MGFFDVVTKRESRAHPVWGWDLLHAVEAWGVYMLLLRLPTFFGVQWAPGPSAVFASLLVLIGVLFVERAQARQRGWSLDSTADLLSYQGLHLPATVLLFDPFWAIGVAGLLLLSYLLVRMVEGQKPWR